LKAGILEGEKEAAIAKQRRGKDVSATINQHSTVEDLLEAGFCVRPKVYVEDQRKLEAGKY
jgi:hypothetical protein